MNIKDVFESLLEPYHRVSCDCEVIGRGGEKIARAIIIENQRGDHIHFKTNGFQITALSRYRKDYEGNGATTVGYKPFNTAPYARLEPFSIDLVKPGSELKLKEHIINSFLEMKEETAIQEIELAQFREWSNQRQLTFTDEY